MTLLEDRDVNSFLDTHRGWSREGDEISQTYQFADFNESLAFVNSVAVAAEKANHHPDIDIRWNKVTLTLSTHSEGGLTRKDLDLAEVFDSLS